MEATFVIAGGYTAGHLTPGFAVAQELNRRYPHLRLVFVGRSDPDEERFVREFGMSFLGFRSYPWASQNPVMRARGLATLLPTIWKARRKFRAVGAVGFLSLGSFAVVGPALAARSLGLPLVVFEPNATFGLANRVLQPLASSVVASRLFEAGTRPLPARCNIVGVPLRSALQALVEHRPNPPSGPTRLLVLGGSLGSPFLNARASGLAQKLVAAGVDLRVTHQCGREADAAAVRAAYTQVNVRVQVESFFDPIAPVLASADFILTAAGAITLHEIAAAGVPLLVTPLRAGAGAHQYANAEAFGRCTGCLVRTEENWDDAGIAKAIAAVVGDRERWTRQSRALQAFVAGNASALVADRIVASIPARCLRG